MTLLLTLLLSTLLLASAPHCDVELPPPTWHQARAEAAAKRHLMDHHGDIAQDTFRHARRQTDLHQSAWEQVKRSMLDNPKRPRCAAPKHWPEQGVVCYQSYRAYQPVSTFIQTSIYVEMRNAAAEGDKANPEVVSAHVRAQGMYVRHEDPEPG
ncbi:MAG: hypothetical protein OXL37_03615 [Chloroflexota bacterium]|nr:hypothetical protein [Chloroflexota bacterium]MDE2958595.1 hypothetical protein [Chloroflexota bacterium]